MPKYQVTLTYLITLNAHDEEDAIWWATQAVESDSDEYNDVEVEEVDAPKDCGVTTQSFKDYCENDPSVECVYRLWKEKYEPQLKK